jgi:AmmeMemoRadiSam system protein A
MSYTADQRHALLNVARAAIRGVLNGGGHEPPALADHHPPALRTPAGCFCSLHEIASRRLRGCVGRLEARDPVLLAVFDAAVSVLEDPRFGDLRVCLHELHLLEIELTILSPLRDAGHPLDFDPPLHGICLSVAGRSGCFLPQVARETGWGREQLLERLCTEKLDLPAHAWRHPAAKLQVFDTFIIGPEAFDRAPAPGAFPLPSEGEDESGAQP